MKTKLDTTRLPPLHTLQTFSVVAATGNFTTASEQLNLSQSAVSRQIQQLEHFFGCSLFDRHTRRVVMTERGAALLPIVEGLLSSFKNSIEASRTQVQSITVRMTPTFTRRWFLPRLGEFKRLHGDLNIIIDTAWFQKPTFGIGDIDIFITYGNGQWPGMHVVPLLHEQLTPMCTPEIAHILATEHSFKKLEAQVLIHSNPRHSDWTLWLQAEGAYSFHAAGHQVFDTQDFALTAAASGLGVAMGDLSLTGEDLKSGKLVTPYERVVDSGYGYYAISPSRPDTRKTIASFTTWLQSACLNG